VGEGEWLPMKCWHCKKELIWGGDHDIEEENESYDMVTNLSCPKCHSAVDVYHPSVKLLKEYKDEDEEKEKIKKISEDYIRKRYKKK
jgi:Zn finger protein HypA/HybF involved in hydrogenase expression